MEDTELATLFWQRDESAISKTHIKYGNYLSAISTNILHNIQDSEECVNDTYLKAWDNIPPQRPSVFRVFLGAIIRNLSLDHYRKNHAQKRVASEFSYLLSELEDCIPSDKSEEKELEDKEIAQEISHFLKDQDSEKQRIFYQAILVLRQHRSDIKTVRLQRKQDKIFPV